MQEESPLLFGAFRVDTTNGCLWHGQQALVLTPKAFAVLRYLVEHPGQLVTKEDLFQAVWPGTYVSDAALTVCIREIRKVLADNPRAPRYIETVHRRGYRFIGKVTSSQYSVVGRETPESGRQAAAARSFSFPPQPSALSPQPSVLIGREAELRQLHGWLKKAQAGERQLVFVTGEPGVGKTALVEAFLQHVAAPQGAWACLGQCIEHFGVGEAYLPILAALGQVCREPGGQRLLEILIQHAPTWLVQMPALFNADEYEVLQQKTTGATRERMLREMAEALEALTAERPLVLVLEDLHWSDASTLALLGFLARRHQPAQLLVIGTYRPTEVIVREHPLKTVKQELQIHERCAEIPLQFLTEENVNEYLERRCPEGVSQPALFRRLADVIYQRTDGNPLFMVTLVEDLVTRGLLVCGESGWELRGEAGAIATGVPESLRQMVEEQVARLSGEDRHVLEVASVAGREFSAAAVAAGLATEVGEVERRCADLTRRSHFLHAKGIAEWPDGTVAARYQFLHALYQEVVYQQVSVGRRVQLHQRIGEREEAARGARAAEAAAELAVHFERGRDYRRAVQYHEQAAQNALRRNAHQEARSLLARGLELLRALPDTPERTQQELRLQIATGALLQAAKGYAAAEVEHTYVRARDLCQQLGETAHLFPVLRGLWVFYLLRAELKTAHELGRQLCTVAQSVRDPALLLEAHYALGATLFFLGEFGPARVHLEQGVSLYNPQQHRAHALLYGQDPGVFCRSVLALTLWLLGYADQALGRIDEGVTLARELSHPNSLAAALFFAAWLHQLRRETPAAHERAESVLAISREQGFPFWLAWGTLMEGGALSEQGQAKAGIARLRHGLTLLQDTGAVLARSYALAVRTEGGGKLGRVEEGLTLLSEVLATVEQTGERFYEAEVYRVKGELILQSSVQRLASRVKNPHSAFRIPHSEAEACFRQAIDIARRQRARSLELRAARSLARLWQHQGKREEARRLLAEVYGWFTEGFETKDLQEATALLQELNA